MKKLIDIPDNWYNKLKDTIESPYFKKLGQYLSNKMKETTVFPHKDEIFRAFNLTPFDKVRVVILGMDPYPNRHKGVPVACGLAFAPRIRDYVSPSLRVMYKKIREDVYPGELSFPIDMNLESWAKQGIFLLNTALTVEEGKSGSHLKPWEEFTDAVLEVLNTRTSGIIFCFWGKDAAKFAPRINKDIHHILIASHPVSAVYKGGEWECDHFTRINQILKANNEDEIVWLQNLN